ncbi:MAG: hypothetical protein DHS20C12_29820 [Pseudohongiella sp.]|nr:MAG: hypothetical protein DHS20C12_29820 [Pseudohongiella sp.]
MQHKSQHQPSAMCGGTPLFGLKCCVVCICSLLYSTTSAQDFDLDDLQFDGDLGFDDSIFADAFDEAESEDSWLDPFTFKLSQQFFGQVNNHSVDLAPGFSFSRKSELENNRLAINIRYQNPFAPGWLLQASAQGRAFLVDDYEYEANGDNFDMEFRGNEFFLQRSFNNSSLKVGRQTVVWGEAVGNSVLDIINPNEFRDLTIIDIEDARLNQWMVVHDYYGESSTVSTFINLFPEFNPAPVRGSPFFFEPQFNLTDYRRDKPLFEVGSRWSKSFEGSDISFMAAYLYENQLRYKDPATGVGDAIAENNDFVLLGFSANRAFGKLLLNFDLAFNHNILADSSAAIVGNGNLQSLDLKKDQIGTSFGFEYQIDNEQSLTVSMLAQKVLDEDDGLQPGQRLVNEGVTGSGLVRYSNALLNGDLNLSASLQGDLKGSFMIGFFSADYILNDFWSISGQINFITAKPSTPLVFFDQDVRVGTTLTYTF